MKNNIQLFLQKYLEEVNHSNYKDTLDEETFEKLKSIDPTKNKTFTKWLINQYLKIQKPEDSKINLKRLTPLPMHGGKDSTDIVNDNPLIRIERR
jgi:hypothetical protein